MPNTETPMLDDDLSVLDLGAGPRAHHADLDEFDRLLRSRTRVPAERLGDIVAWSEQKLHREATIVGRTLKEFATAVAAGYEDAASAEAFVGALDLKVFSRDHEWRAVFSTLRARPAGRGEFQRAAMIRYLQYLAFRARLLGFIQSKRQALAETGERRAVQHYGRAARAAGLVRLPLGECVRLRMTTGEVLELMLASRRFRLAMTATPCLVDEAGSRLALHPGRNLVGRHPDSDVRVDPSWDDVSRVHLLVEIERPDRIGIQDLSTHGTYLSEEVLTSARSQALR